MKTHNNLYDQITSFDNLLLASKKAQRGKRFKRSTALFNFKLEQELVSLQKELSDLSYRHGGYRNFFIYDPKRRLISAAPYRDRVVHHALCNVIEPLFDSAFIFDSYACRKGKGTHKGVERFSSFIKKNNFVLKCDLKKYFQSIDHEILYEMLERKIACKNTLWLIREIIDSWSDRNSGRYFLGDDLYTPDQRKHGIPIGNLTSQFFANLYLDAFDHFVKEKLRCQYYIRYVDDFVVFGNSKAHLHEIKKQMERYLSSLRVTLHPKKCRIHTVKEGISFLGYRIFTTHRLLKKENALRMRRRLRKLSQDYYEGQIDFDEINARIQSWIGHASHANTYHLRSKILGSVAFQRGETRDATRRLLEQQTG